MAQKGKLTTANALTVEQLNHLITCLHQDRLYKWELFCLIAYCCALRASDVLKLRWADILDKEYINITEKKTKKVRSIPINENVKNKIKDIYNLSNRPQTGEFIVSNPKTRNPYTIKHVNELLKTFRVKYRLKIKNFSTHSFRKTFGRMVYETSGRSAESLILLNTIFKHSGIQATKTYIGITGEEIDKVFDSIKV